MSDVGRFVVENITMDEAYRLIPCLNWFVPAAWRGACDVDCRLVSSPVHNPCLGDRTSCSSLSCMDRNQDEL